MQNAGSHVGQLTKFSVCNGLNDLRIIDDARIGYEKAGDVGPVLIHISMDGLRYNGACDIGSAS